MLSDNIFEMNFLKARNVKTKDRLGDLLFRKINIG